MAAIAFFVYEAVGPVNLKYNGYYNKLHVERYSGLVDIEGYNRDMGIDQKDLVISMPDGSNNISLYLMNQPGFTDFGFVNFQKKERMDYFISLGAKYLVVSDTGLLQKRRVSIYA